MKRSEIIRLLDEVLREDRRVRRLTYGLSIALTDLPDTLVSEIVSQRDEAESVRDRARRQLIESGREG